jgi:hypothetical protein
MTLAWIVYGIGTLIGVNVVVAFASLSRMSNLIWEIRLVRRDLHYLRLDVISNKNPVGVSKIDFKENAFKKDN